MSFVSCSPRHRRRGLCLHPPFHTQQSAAPMAPVAAEARTTERERLVAALVFKVGKLRAKVGAAGEPGGGFGNSCRVVYGIQSNWLPFLPLNP